MGRAPSPSSSFASIPVPPAAVRSPTSPEPGQRNDLFLYSPFHLSSVHRKAAIHLSMRQLEKKKKPTLCSAWKLLRLALPEAGYLTEP